MTKHGTRLVSGVRELILTEGTTLEDLHMVAVDVILAIDKVAARTVRKLKEGQRIRCYVESSNKEYGTKGSDVICCYRGVYDTQTYGTKLKVYDENTNKEWNVGIDCLLEIYESFDPNSALGQKTPTEVIKPKTKKRGRRSKKEQMALAHDALDAEDNWNFSYTDSSYEDEVDGEEYNFNDYDEYRDFFDD